MLKRCVGLTFVLSALAGCSQSAPSGSAPTAPSSTAAPPASTSSQPPGIAAQPQTYPSAITPTPPAVSSPTGAPSASPTSVQDLVAQAKQAIGPQPSSASDFPGAIKLLEEAIAKEPNNSSVLGLLAQYTQFHGMVLMRRGAEDAVYGQFQKSGDYFRKLREVGQPLDETITKMAPQILYNEACVFAKQQKTDKAVASLGEAFDAGWADIPHMDKDTDFDLIRESAEFKALREQAPARVLAIAKEHAKTLMTAHQPFDFNFALPDLEGKTISLADFKGKVLIVDIWGTWCPPCRMEIPHFVELHKKYGEAGLEIVGVNYERVPEEKVNETIKKFVEDNGVTYSCVIGDQETQTMIPEFSAFPTTLFIDRAGKVRLKVVNYHPLPSLEAIVSILLAETGSVPAAN